MSHIYEEDLESRLLRFASEKGDATIVAHLRAGRAVADRLTETMEKLIYTLSSEKSDIQKKFVDYINTDTRPIEFLARYNHKVTDLKPSDSSQDKGHSKSSNTTQTTPKEEV